MEGKHSLIRKRGEGRRKKSGNKSPLPASSILLLPPLCLTHWTRKRKDAFSSPLPLRGGSLFFFPVGGGKKQRLGRKALGDREGERQKGRSLANDPSGGGGGGGSEGEE